MKLSLTPRLEDLFYELCGEGTPAHLAEDVLRLSDFYVHHHGARTPWGEAYTARAYGAYFLPLNVLRLKGAFRELERFLKPEHIREVWDFGSGLGAFHWVLEEQNWLAPRPFHCVEAAPRAIEHHRTFMQNTAHHWRPDFNPRKKPGSGALAVFSYSYLEMRGDLPNLTDFDHILIVEPSFRDTSRALMSARHQWIQDGFTPLAPCTHSQACPLLKHSDRDWCHQRIHVELSKRMVALEQHLPMQNHTLTYSYLLVSRLENPAWRGAARVIGDTLHERGKIRQMICRGSEREFLSWLTRHGEPPPIPHGALIEDLGPMEIKNNELRVQKNLAWSE